MIIKTYSELSFFINMFKNGNADLVIIESSGGLGKSRLIETIMSEESHLRILSHITPMQMFILGFKYKNLPIIIDDCDGLLNSEETVGLLKMFCETIETKEIAWLTTHNLLNQLNIPQRYETKSKVCILTNDFKELTKKISALKDRGWYIEFKPNDEEILNKIREIIPLTNNKLSYEEKLEIFNLIKVYSKFCEFSLRTFVKGLQLYEECKNKEIDWKEILLNDLKINPKLVLLNSLLENNKGDKKRIEEWESQGFSRRSFYDYKNLLVQKCSHIPKIPAQLHTRK